MGKKLLLSIVAILVLSVSVSAYASKITSEQARAKLKQLGIEYTTESFINSAKQADVTVVNLFLKAGIDVNAKNKDGATALMAAAFKGHTETAKTLIEAGADVNARAKEGKTALMVAVFMGHTETAKALIEAGANVNAKDKEGGTALMAAAGKRHPETVNLLKKHGAR